MSIVKAITGILVATGMTIGSSGICNASTLDSGRETTATSTTVSVISSGLEDAYREIYSQALTVPLTGHSAKPGSSTGVSLLRYQNRARSYLHFMSGLGGTSISI